MVACFALALSFTACSDLPIAPEFEAAARSLSEGVEQYDHTLTTIGDSVFIASPKEPSPGTSGTEGYWAHPNDHSKPCPWSEGHPQRRRCVWIPGTEGDSGDPGFVRLKNLTPATLELNNKGYGKGKSAGTGYVEVATESGTDTVSVLVQGTVDSPKPPHDPEDPAVPGPPAECSSSPHDRLVRVSTATQLTDAIRNVRAGDLIQLADGTYTGRWRLTASGTAEKPIVLCGTRAAVLRYGTYDTDAVLTLRNANHWVLQGFTVRSSLWGLVLEGSSHNRLLGLEVHDIGQEAVALKHHSSHNIVQDNRIRDTGRRGGPYVEWGEGIYVGSWSGHWVNGAPDRSDYNQILGNVIGPNIGSEHIDIKEGTTGGVIRGNTFDGNGMGFTKDYNDSWVIMHGNGYTVENNRGFVSPRHGFKAVRQLAGWGNNNVFRNNVADVQASGYGFFISSWTSGNVVHCDNRALAAGSGLSSVKCTQ